MVSNETRTEQQPLTGEEKYILESIRNKRIFYIIGTYLGLSYVFIEGWTLGDHPYLELLELFKFNFFLSQFVLALWILLTIFFIRYYLQVGHPYVKDVRLGMKDIVLFKPVRYKTPFFEDYYLETPLKKRSLVKINREVYEAINDDTTACLHLSPYAKYVLLVDIGGRKMKFNGSDSFVDL